jgi:hypothetical protein
MGGLEDKLHEILSSPEDMSKLMEMVKSISGSLGAPSAADGGDGVISGGGGDAGDAKDGADAGGGAVPPFDPEIFGVITRVMGAYASGAADKNALLGAIKPYLRSSRREYMDKAAEIVKLTRIARAALSEFSGGDVNV